MPNTAATLLRNQVVANERQAIADTIAQDFAAQLDAWHSQPETWDNELDTQIHRWYADAKNVWPQRPYFSPSSATSCPRELYVKAKRAKKDRQPKQPHQGRWTQIGTAVGDVIQRDVLAAARNMPDARFDFERNDDGTPVFEDFAKRNTPIEHNGQTFYLYGTCDGIMRYVSEDGHTLRVGLEVKSKQTTAARTSLYSLKEAEEKHVKQCVGYSIMYNVDYYVILYVNTAHKSWGMTPEDYAKTPDVRAFGIAITDEDRTALLDRLAQVNRSIVGDEPLPMELRNGRLTTSRRRRR